MGLKENLGYVIKPLNWGGNPGMHAIPIWNAGGAAAIPIPVGVAAPVIQSGRAEPVIQSGNPFTASPKIPPLGFKPMILIPRGTYFARFCHPGNVIPEDNRATFYGLVPEELRSYEQQEKKKVKKPGEVGQDWYLVAATRNLYILDMRFVSVFQHILRRCKGTQLHKAIRHAFFYGQDHIKDEDLQTISRMSHYIPDRIYTNIFCKYKAHIQDMFDLTKPIDGYMFPHYHLAEPQPGFDNFHFENFICEPIGKLRIIASGKRQFTQVLQRNPGRFFNVNNFKQITVGLGNLIDKLQFVDIPVNEFYNIFVNSLVLRNKIISRRSAFSIIMKSIYLYSQDVYSTNPSRFLKYSLITKITKFNYQSIADINMRKNQAQKNRYTKNLIDSFLLEFINGLCINTYTTVKNYFVTTYLLDLFSPEDDEKNQGFISQIQEAPRPGQRQRFDFSAIGSIGYSIRYHTAQEIAANPVQACINYELSRFASIMQQCVENNMTVSAYLDGTHPKKDKLLNTIRFSFKIYEVLNSLQNVEFAHNDLHLSNVLIDKDKNCTYEIPGHRSFEKLGNPVIIDYGRCHTEYSREFLQAIERTGNTEICATSRTNRFKNNYTNSIDLLFLWILRQKRQIFETGSQDQKIQSLKERFLGFLEGLPEDQYFNEVLASPHRISYEVWARERGLIPRAIPTVRKAYEGLQNILANFYGVLSTQ